MIFLENSRGEVTKRKSIDVKYALLDVVGALESFVDEFVGDDIETVLFDILMEEAGLGDTWTDCHHSYSEMLIVILKIFHEIKNIAYKCLFSNIHLPSWIW